MRIEVPSERSGHFNGLRLLFAVAVCYSHAYSGTGHQDPLQALSNGQFVPSQLGVYGFFVVSGFLVWRSLMRSAGAPIYLMKRALRILPALALVVLLSVWVLGPLITDMDTTAYAAEPLTWRYLLNPWVMLRGGVIYDLPGVFTALPVTAVNVSLWTLPYEILFYGLLLVFLPCRRWPWLTGALLGAAWIAGCISSYTPVAGHIPHTSFAWADIGRFAPCFLGGCLLSVTRMEAHLAKAPALWLLISVGALALFAGAFEHVKLLLLPPLVIGAAHMPLPVRIPPLPVDLSYGFYLSAWPLQQVLYTSFQLQPLPLFLSTALAAATYGWLSWTWVERPVLAWKPALADRLQRKREGWT